MKTHMQIRSIGKPPEPWIKEAVNSYATRCSPFGKLELMELPEGHSGSAKPNLIRTKQIEAQSLTRNLPEGALVIALDEKGRQYGSQEFAERIEKEASGGRTIIFLIGGSWGLEESIFGRADMTMSLGKLTLPHSLVRIVLLEQIYRAHMISAGREYHK
jgi:23S rRNA (pseudouridine1915-N3)-methyltransferase